MRTLYLSGSLQSVARKYRSELSIITETLEYAYRNGKVKKTHLMNACNLNSQNAKKYLGRMVKGGLLAEERIGREVHYSITAKGVFALMMLKSVTRFLDGSNTLTSQCGEALSEVVVDHGYTLNSNVYLLAESGVRFPFTYYIPEAGVAVLVLDSANDMVSEFIYHYVVSALVGLDEERLRRIILVVPNGDADYLRVGLSALGEWLASRVSVITSCDRRTLAGMVNGTK